MSNQKSSIVNWIDFPNVCDERGSLVTLESSVTVPFNIERVYYIFGNEKGIARGFHAHKALKQVAVCVSGRCKIILDDGVKREEAWLDNPTKGILIDHLIWREMHEFSSDCVLLVLANKHYSESDYIRNYDSFRDLVANN